jgi:hypothetical protein
VGQQEVERAKLDPPRARKRNIAVPRNSPNAQMRSFRKPSWGRLYLPYGRKWIIGGRRRGAGGGAWAEGVERRTELFVAESDVRRASMKNEADIDDSGVDK